MISGNICRILRSDYIGNCKVKTVCLRGVDDTVMEPP